jgi:hypothetical protein
VSRTRIVNGVRYRWTPRGWEAVAGRRKPAHWSDAHPAGLKAGPDPVASSDEAEESQGREGEF